MRGPTRYFVQNLVWTISADQKNLWKELVSVLFFRQKKIYRTENCPINALSFFSGKRNYYRKLLPNGAVFVLFWTHKRSKNLTNFQFSFFVIWCSLKLPTPKLPSYGNMEIVAIWDQSIKLNQQNCHSGKNQLNGLKSYFMVWKVDINIWV